MYWNAGKRNTANRWSKRWLFSNILSFFLRSCIRFLIFRSRGLCCAFKLFFHPLGPSTSTPLNFRGLTSIPAIIWNGITHPSKTLEDQRFKLLKIFFIISCGWGWNKWTSSPLYASLHARNWSKNIIAQFSDDLFAIILSTQPILAPLF